MSHGRARSDEVGRGRNQDLRLRRRAVGSGSGRRAAAHVRRARSDHVGGARVEAGVDSIEHGSFLTEATLKLMKQKGVYLVPTRMAVYWIDREANTYPPKIQEKARAAAAAHGSMLKMAIKLGVPIAFGTDAGVFPHGMNAHEFAL